MAIGELQRGGTRIDSHGAELGQRPAPPQRDWVGAELVVVGDVVCVVCCMSCVSCMSCMSQQAKSPRSWETIQDSPTYSLPNPLPTPDGHGSRLPVFQIWFACSGHPPSSHRPSRRLRRLALSAGTEPPFFFPKPSTQPVHRSINTSNASRATRLSGGGFSVASNSRCRTFLGPSRLSPLLKQSS
jgi:hypothetical protein